MVESTDTNNSSPDKTPPAKKKSRLFDKLLAEAESNNDFWRHCKDHNDGDSGIDVSSLEMSMSTTMKGGEEEIKLECEKEIKQFLQSRQSPPL
jgi:hypothetical protein